MARTRAIDPEFFLDEDLAAMTPLTRILFIGLWTLADREGRLEDRAPRIRAQLFPYDPTLDVDAMLVQLAVGRFVQRYELGGRRFLQIRNFLKFQTPHPREQPSEIPAPPAASSMHENLGLQAENPGQQVTHIKHSDLDLDPDLRPSDRDTDAPARDPRTTGHSLQQRWGVVRSQILGGLPWSTPPVRDGKAETFASQLTPEASADVEGTMRLALGHIRDGVAGWDKPDMRNSHGFGFSCWLARFDGLREELHGLQPAARASPGSPPKRKSAAEQLANVKV